MNVYQDLAQYLQNQGLGTVAETIFTGHLPAEPATAFVIVPTGGYGLDKPTFQIMTRGSNFDIGWNKAIDISNTIIQLGRIDLPNGTETIDIIPLQPTPIQVERDQLNRFLFVQNFRWEYYNPNVQHLD